MIRDSKGEVVSTVFGKLEKVLEPFHAELIACLQALQQASDLGLQRVILETNASMVVQSVMSAETDRSSASDLVWELKAFLRLNFVSWSVVHNPRSCNAVLMALLLSLLFGAVSPGTAPVSGSIPKRFVTMLGRNHWFLRMELFAAVDHKKINYL